MHSTPSNERFMLLFKRWFHNHASEEELKELVRLYQDVDDDTTLSDTLKMQWNQFQSTDEIDHEFVTRVGNSILNTQFKENEIVFTPVAHRVHLLKTAWFRVAVAILIIASIGAYRWFQPSTNKSTIVQKPVPARDDILPGYNRAMLTLSDGKIVELDSAASETIQDGTLAIQNQHGQITYNDSKTNNSLNPRLNTMTTPRGGQYQLLLPDGSKVWLNAESSITFPTAFINNTRTVKIVGEAYFEVAKNAAAPFRVVVNNEMEVEVLGTHFNINAYEDNAAIYTTLLEGKVRVINLKSPVSVAHSRAMLEPGQQAFVWRNSKQSNGIEIKSANLEDVMAWRKGKFNFQGKELKDAMKELERWYDIKVVYEKNPPQIVFEGEIDRNLKLSQVLNGLKDMGVKFNLTEDGRLIIDPVE
jgi:transmembrane sensor